MVASATKKTPSSNSSRRSAASLQGQAGLARTSRPGEGEQSRLLAHEPVQPPQPPARGPRAGGLHGQVVGAALQRPKGWELGGRSGCTSWKILSGPEEVLEPMLPHVLEPDAGRQLVAHQLLGGRARGVPARRGRPRAGEPPGLPGGRSSPRPSLRPPPCAAPSAPVMAKLLVPRLTRALAGQRARHPGRPELPGRRRRRRPRPS